VADLKGVVDVHVHFGPDTVPRVQTAVSVARGLAEAGMAAVCLKSHGLPTVQAANAVQEIVDGPRIFGGVTLNRPVGGINPHAVEAALTLGAKMVWLPTKDAANHIAHFGLDTANTVPVLDGDGAPTGRLRTVLRMIADAGVCLSLGHISGAEATVITEHARSVGVERILVAHPLFETQNLSLETQRRLAEAGAYLEHCWLQVIPEYPGGVGYERLVAAINAVGPERVVLSSDTGRADFPDTVTAMTRYRGALEPHFSPADLDRMFIHNPAHCMGISPKEQTQ
jgi:Family of unknown function (DUF6282)